MARTEAWPIGSAHHGSFNDFGMTDERTFDFGSTESMASDVQHIVNPADDPEVSILIPARPVAR